MPTDIPKHIMACLECQGAILAEIDPASVKMSPALQKEILRVGSLHPRIVLNLTADPTIEFTAYNIKLCNVPTVIATGVNPVKLYFRAMDSVFGLGIAWISVAVSAGLVEPVSLKGSRGKLAELHLRIHPISATGDALPVTVGTTAATIPAPTNYFTLGVVTVATALAGVTDFTLNFGYAVKKNQGENGKPFATEVYCAEQTSTIDISLESIAAATSARMFAGTVETVVTAAFRKVTQAAMPVDSGGLLLTAGKAFATAPSLSGGTPANTSLNLDILAAAVDGTGYLVATDIA